MWEILHTVFPKKQHYTERTHKLRKKNTEKYPT